MASPDAATKPPFRWNTDGFDDNSFRVHGSALLAIILVFSVILILTLFYLYVRWVYRKRQPVTPPDANRAATESAGRELLEIVVVGLDRETIDGFPVLLRGLTAEEAQCSICLGNLAEGDKVKVLPGCGHDFHPQCVDAWLKTQASCPLCRASLVTSSDGAVAPAV